MHQTGGDSSDTKKAGSTIIYQIYYGPTCESMFESKLLLYLAILAALASASKRLSVEQQKRVQEKLVKALGLGNVPNLLPSDREKVQIPEAIKELYAQQTGLSIDTTNFRLPGQHVGSSNTARTYSSRQVTSCGSASSVCILGFDLPHEPFKKETMQSAQLKVYWKPTLSIKRSIGSFRASVHDVLKLQKPHMTMVVDTKKIHHRDAERDEGYYSFDVTTAVQRWLDQSKKPKQQLLAVEKGRIPVHIKEGSHNMSLIHI